MINELNEQSYQFPYIWDSAIEQDVLAHEILDGFKHIHIHGSAGIGKTRCINEVTKIYHRKYQNLKLARYDTQYNLVDHIDPLISIASQLNLDCMKGLDESLETKAKKNEILIIFEDIHYVDDARDQLIDWIIDRFTNHSLPITLLTSSRKDWQGCKTHNFHTIHIQKMKANKAHDLIEAGCKKNKNLKTIKAELAKKAKGNPLFICEAMKLLGQNNDYNIEALSNIETLYSETLDNFNDAERELLEAASIIGFKFHLHELEILLPHRQKYLSSILDSLCQREILSSNPSKNVYEFSHVLQQESIYKQLVDNRRIAYHIELFYLYKNLRNFEACGMHLYNGGQYKESIPYLSYSARHLLKRVQPQKAELLFRKAISAFKNIGATHKHSYRKLQRDYCMLLTMQGKVTELEKFYSGMNKTNSMDFCSKDTEFMGLEITYRWLSSNYDPDYVLILLDKIPNSQAMAMNKLRLLAMLVDFGRFKLAREKLRNFREHHFSSHNFLTSASFTPIETTYKALIANLYAQTNQKNKMDHAIDDCLILLNQCETPSKKVYGLAFSAKAFQTQGQYEKAKPLIEEAYSINRKHKIGIVTPDVLSIYADNLIHTGNPIMALAILDELMEFIHQNGIVANEAMHIIVQAKGFLDLGMKEIAKTLVIKSMDIADRQKNMFQKASACLLLARIIKDENSKYNDQTQDEIRALLRITKDIAIDCGAEALLSECDKVVP